MANSKVNNIVLVHGGFVDGSGWQNVYTILKNMGFNVSIVQNPTTSLADDVVATNRVIDVQDGPVVLAGHSYGGVVITEAGNNPKVARLAYITAFAPDNGRVGWYVDQGPDPRSAGAAHHAAAGWFSPPRPHKVCRFICRGCKTQSGRLHGCLPGAVGTGCAKRSGKQRCLEVQTKLVSRRH
jgi:pimeloyl-ACP methyl ester carboxylesterase